MTEAEWLASRDPARMLGFLRKSYPHLSAEAAAVRGCWVIDLVLGKA